MQDLKGKTIRGGVLQGSVPKARVLSCVWALMVFDSALGPKRLWIVGMAAAFTGVWLYPRPWWLRATSLPPWNPSEAENRATSPGWWILKGASVFRVCWSKGG